MTSATRNNRISNREFDDFPEMSKMRQQKDPARLPADADLAEVAVPLPLIM